MRNSKNHPSRLLYTSELICRSGEYIKPFFDWYAYRHAPDIYQIGFEVCTSYRGIEGDMSIFDLYEINTVDVFDTAKYRAVSANDPYSGPLLANRTAKAHSIYSQLYVAPEPEDSRPLLNCDWIRVDRFNASATELRALFDYLDAGEAERILLAGAKRSGLRSGPRRGQSTCRTGHPIWCCRNGRKGRLSLTSGPVWHSSSEMTSPISPPSLATGFIHGRTDPNCCRKAPSDSVA